MTAPKGYEGLLEVHGTLDIAQCWPTGESDADTSHVVDATGFGPARQPSQRLPQPTPRSAASVSPLLASSEASKAQSVRLVHPRELLPKPSGRRIFAPKAFLALTLHSVTQHVGSPLSTMSVQPVNSTESGSFAILLK